MLLCVDTIMWLCAHLRVLHSNPAHVKHSFYWMAYACGDDHDYWESARECKALSVYASKRPAKKW